LSCAESQQSVKAPPVADGPLPWQRRRRELLRIEHRDLDHAIGALAESPVPDQLQLARFKKRKLRLRDEIAWLEDKLIPDIIA
jgi:hypothetical protein